jgi:hypothetical protein
MSAAMVQLHEPQRSQRPRILEGIARHRSTIEVYRQLSPDAQHDLIFGQIEKHCDALVVYHSATNDDVSTRAMNREAEVLHELFRYGATSVPGILALLHHLGSPEFLIFDPKEETGDTILSEAVEISADNGKSIAHALKCMLSVAVQVALPAVDEAGSPR